MNDTILIISGNWNKYKGRYIIVNRYSGYVIDDAQGYGFKTEEKARNCYVYKVKHIMYSWQLKIQETVDKAQ